MHCIYCGKPTLESEFFTVSGGRRPAHIACMAKEGARAFDTGALDGLRIAVNWPDGPAEITTGERVRKSLRKNC